MLPITVSSVTVVLLSEGRMHMFPMAVLETGLQGHNEDEHCASSVSVRVPRG